MSGADVMDPQQTESPEIAALHQAAEALEQSSPQEILRWAVDRYAPHISLACSFGMQSVVVIDMLHRIDTQTIEIEALHPPDCIIDELFAGITITPIDIWHIGPEKTIETAFGPVTIR